MFKNHNKILHSYNKIIIFIIFSRIINPIKLKRPNSNNNVNIEFLKLFQVQQCK